MSAHGHWHAKSWIETAIDFTIHPHQYKGVIHPHNGNPLKIPEWLLKNMSDIASDVRKAVEDVIKPSYKALWDMWEWLKLQKNGFLAPIKWLAGATVKVLESVNRSVIGTLDLFNLSYKRAVIDSATIIAQNTTDRLPYIGGIAVWNGVKWVVSLPMHITDWVSNIWDKFGPSAWLRWINKFVSIEWRSDLPSPQLRNVWHEATHWHEAH